MKPTKATFQTFHAVARAKERKGKDFSLADIQSIIDIIQSNNPLDRKAKKFLEKQSLRISKWEVSYQNDTFIVIYDKNRKTIVTILPDES